VSAGEIIVAGVGYGIAVLGGGAFVEGCLGRLLTADEQEEIDGFRRRGLSRAGRWIGWLERFLTYTFVLTGSYTAIGLVLAAKGIIRFGEIKEATDQKVAEYVLVGTMLSLSWAIAVAGLVHWLRN